MDSRGSEPAADSEPAAPGPPRDDVLPASASTAVKIVIVGGFGVGKTTMAGAVSEIRPLTTEETMTEAGVGSSPSTSSAPPSIRPRRCARPSTCRHMCRWSSAATALHGPEPGATRQGSTRGRVPRTARSPRSSSRAGPRPGWCSATGRTWRRRALPTASPGTHGSGGSGGRGASRWTRHSSRSSAGGPTAPRRTVSSTSGCVPRSTTAWRGRTGTASAGAFSTTRTSSSTPSANRAGPIWSRSSPGNCRCWCSPGRSDRAGGGRALAGGMRGAGRGRREGGRVQRLPHQLADDLGAKPAREARARLRVLARAARGGAVRRGGRRPPAHGDGRGQRDHHEPDLQHARAICP